MGEYTVIVVMPVLCSRVYISEWTSTSMGLEEGNEPCLKEQEPKRELDSTLEMEFSASSAGQHCPIVEASAGLSFKLDSAVDILELSDRLGMEGVSFSSQSTEDDFGFLESSDLDQPARGFRHEEE